VAADQREDLVHAALLDEDGQPFPPPDSGEPPIQAGGQIEAGRPAGLAPGAEINVPVAFNTVLQLPPARRFAWVLDIDGKTDDAWRLPFATGKRSAAGLTIPSRLVPGVPGSARAGARRIRPNTSRPERDVLAATARSGHDAMQRRRVPTGWGCLPQAGGL